MARAVRGRPPRHPHSLCTTTRGSLNHDGNRHRGRIGLKVTCDRDEFVANLGTVSRVVSTRSSVQVLSGVLLTARRRLARARRDRHGGLAARDARRVGRERSSIVVPGKLLVDLARLLPAAEVTLEYRPGRRRCTSRAAATRRNCNASRPRTSRGSRRVDLAPTRSRRASLLETVDRVARSASQRRVTPGADRDPGALRGTQLSWPRPTRTGSRSSRPSSSSPAPTSRRSSPPAPSRSSRGSPPARRRLRSACNENTVVFGTGDTWLTTRRIDGQFPDVGQLLPESFEVSLVLPRASCATSSAVRP